MAKQKNGSYAHNIATIQNAATTLLANIRFASMDRPVKSIVITSAIPNEGKSAIACNLVQAMASSGKRTLVVDCDTRNRSVASRYNLHPKAGLFSLLSKQAPLEDVLTPTPVQSLSIIDIEPSIPNPADIFASKRFQSFLAQMEEMFDYIVIDTPPVNAFIDAAVLASHADATILVVRENLARRDEIAYACEQLRKADANLIGTCMNFCTHQGGSYYGSSYGAYYGSSEPATHHDNSVYVARSAAPRSGSASRSTGTRFKS